MLQPLTIPAPPPSPILSDPDALAILAQPRPGTVYVEHPDTTECGWCGIPLNQGKHHVWPVHCTPTGHTSPIFYGSPDCARSAYEHAQQLQTTDVGSRP